MSGKKRETKVVRISKGVYEEAMEAKSDEYNYMTTGVWLSFLIKKGLEKIKETSE